VAGTIGAQGGGEGKRHAGDSVSQKETLSHLEKRDSDKKDTRSIVVIFEIVDENRARREVEEARKKRRKITPTAPGILLRKQEEEKGPWG